MSSGDVTYIGFNVETREFSVKERDACDCQNCRALKNPPTPALYLLHDSDGHEFLVCYTCMNVARREILSRM